MQTLESIFIWIQSFALSLAFIVRFTATRKWPISFFRFCQETFSGFADTDRLKEKILEVLKQIHGEKGDNKVRVDMWCHFGHAYITKVDEGK